MRDSGKNEHKTPHGSCAQAFKECLNACAIIAKVTRTGSFLKVGVHEKVSIFFL